MITGVLVLPSFGNSVNAKSQMSYWYGILYSQKFVGDLILVVLFLIFTPLSFIQTIRRHLPTPCSKCCLDMPCAVIAITCVISVHFHHSLFLVSPAVSCSKVTLLCRLLSATTTLMLHASSFRRVSVPQFMQWVQVGPTIMQSSLPIQPWTVG